MNLAADVRVLINNRAPEQRGTIVDVPGALVDVLADPGRDRFYVLRQDKNQVLVFDATTNQQIATLRTGNTPTPDGGHLRPGHATGRSPKFPARVCLRPEHAEASGAGLFPAGHYPRSIASSGHATPAASRVDGPAHTIDRVDLALRTASTPATLGPYENNVNLNTVLAASSNGASILAAMPDGTVILYDANVDSFTASRKDFTSLAGAYAASNFNFFLADNHLLNESLVCLYPGQLLGDGRLALRVAAPVRISRRRRRETDPRAGAARVCLRDLALRQADPLLVNPRC